MPELNAQHRLSALKPWLDLLVSLFLIAAAAMIIYRGFGSTTRTRPSTPVPQAVVSIAGPTLGASEAPVVMIMFSDFQCPFCKRFTTEVLPSLRADYVSKNQIQIVFRHMTSLSRPFSAKAAEASECAGRQGKFWQMHDVLFENSPNLEAARLGDYAQAATVDAADFNSCLRDEETAKRVRDDNALAERLTITGTPAFLLGVREGAGVRVQRVISGAKPLHEFQRAIDEIMK